MDPKSIEIKATLAGADVHRAVAALSLTKDKAKVWRIAFCEDVTRGIAPSTPLLDHGVVFRVRGRSGTKGDSTVKLRPCRWSQLSKRYADSGAVSGHDLKIEADWAGPKRNLAASLTFDWTDDRLDSVRSGDLTPAALFTDEQQRFLNECSPSPVNLDALTALADITATRFEEFAAQVGDSTLSCRAERWVIEDAFDFLEVSIVSDLTQAVSDQAALQQFLADHDLAVEPEQDNKTQRVLRYLVARAGSSF